MIITSQARRGRSYRWLAVLIAAALMTLAAPAYAAAPEIVKYYVVLSQYAGHAESLPEISGRFLGTADRAAELMTLNEGRVQPDGSKLTDPKSPLHAGWLIVLPWDAVGEGVIVGVLPTPAPPKPAKASPPASARRPAPTPVSTPAPKGQCAGVQSARPGVDAQWAQLRLAPEQAWSRGRGGGVTVAIVDSGVDAAVPALSGRVNVGADILSGTGRGNVDCLGTGTAVAALIAAHPDQGGSVTGVAPDVVVMPVRIMTDVASAAPADQTSGIDVAVSAGAGVIALGSTVDLSRPEVLSAVNRAAGHDVVVVTGATKTSAILPIAGMLRVASVGVDGNLGDSYAADGVDVVAPGVNITSLGISGTGTFYGSGTQYAVAFVAGQAALVRSADPDATASEVAERIKSTAVAIAGRSRPDPSYGWGMINLAGSVQAPPPATSPPIPGVVPTHSGVSRTALWVTVTLAGMLGLLLVWRVRRAVRTGPATGSAASDDGGDVFGDPGPPGVPGEPRSARPAWAMSREVPLRRPHRSGIGGSDMPDAGWDDDAEPREERAPFPVPTAARAEPRPRTWAELGSRSTYGTSDGRT